MVSWLTWSRISAFKGELVAERLAAARRHDREDVAPVEHLADDLLLPGPELGKAEGLGQDHFDALGHGGSRRSGSAPEV
jgi:hypothetical protein